MHIIYNFTLFLVILLEELCNLERIKEEGSFSLYPPENLAGRQNLKIFLTLIDTSPLSQEISWRRDTRPMDPILIPLTLFFSHLLL
jgi:hypothetical protein